jgi:hypothetical protein
MVSWKKCSGTMSVLITSYNISTKGKR